MKFLNVRYAIAKGLKVDVSSLLLKTEFSQIQYCLIVLILVDIGSPNYFRVIEYCRMLNICGMLCSRGNNVVLHWLALQSCVPWLGLVVSRLTGSGGPGSISSTVYAISNSQ